MNLSKLWHRFVQFHWKPRQNTIDLDLIREQFLQEMNRLDEIIAVHDEIILDDSKYFHLCQKRSGEFCWVRKLQTDLKHWELVRDYRDNLKIMSKQVWQKRLSPNVYIPKDKKFIYSHSVYVDGRLRYMYCRKIKRKNLPGNIQGGGQGEGFPFLLRPEKYAEDFALDEVILKWPKIDPIAMALEIFRQKISVDPNQDLQAGQFDMEMKIPSTGHNNDGDENNAADRVEQVKKALYLAELKCTFNDDIFKYIN